MSIYIYSPLKLFSWLHEVAVVKFGVILEHPICKSVDSTYVMTAQKDLILCCKLNNNAQLIDECFMTNMMPPSVAKKHRKSAKPGLELANTDMKLPHRLMMFSL